MANYNLKLLIENYSHTAAVGDMVTIDSLYEVPCLVVPSSTFYDLPLSHNTSVTDR